MRISVTLSSLTTEEILGNLVIVSEKESVLIHPRYVIPFRSFRSVTTENLILDGVDKVARQAWEAVAKIQPPDGRLDQAKKQVLRLVHQLSPSIRGKVEHHFTSNKWGPLMSRRPK
jgi:hypothetical protein